MDQILPEGQEKKKPQNSTTKPQQKPLTQSCTKSVDSPTQTTKKPFFGYRKPVFRIFVSVLRLFAAFLTAQDHDKSPNFFPSRFQRLWHCVLIARVGRSAYNEHRPRPRPPPLQATTVAARRDVATSSAYMLRVARVPHDLPYKYNPPLPLQDRMVKYGQPALLY